MFERFLARLSNSVYKDKFVFKGGMLVAAIVGLDNRATMDLDTTLKNLLLTLEGIQYALKEICTVDLRDDVQFLVGNLVPSREDDTYGGYRAPLTALYDTMNILMFVDVTTGDVVTPDPIRYTLNGIIDDDVSIEIWAYNIESILAEKIETILRRSEFNTRPRDFYDTYILFTTQTIDRALFKEALSATSIHRGTAEQISDIQELLQTLSTSSVLRNRWDGYRDQFGYAKEITYDMIMGVLENLLD